ncbi:MAG: sensor histidine kinase [Rhodoluna sp.]
MIRWIQDHKWLASAALAVFNFLVVGGINLITQGPTVLYVIGAVSLAILFAANIPAITIALMILVTVLEISLKMLPLIGGMGLLIAVFVLAAFGTRLWRITALATSIICGIAVAWANSIALPLSSQIYGLQFTTPLSQDIEFAILAGLVGAGSFLAWLLGRLAITREVYVGTDFDRALSAENHARLNLEIAEQNERFEIARDINELIIQKVTAVISQAEGGAYAAKADATSAPRSLERIGQSARAAHVELRRLYDMLNKTHKVSAAPPGIDDLEQLIVAYRELGFNVSLHHEGERFAIAEGAGLAVYRIVFDALENARKHCIVGTTVSIDFSWVPDGMQVLIKDNGIETDRRSDVNLDITQSSYTAEDDLRALVEPIKGAGINAMRERAALYGGSVEATLVPGVGFTISAIFPHLRALARI